MKSEKSMRKKKGRSKRRKNIHVKEETKSEVWIKIPDAFAKYCQGTTQKRQFHGAFLHDKT
jgi:hypothetical protein